MSRYAALDSPKGSKSSSKSSYAEPQELNDQLVSAICEQDLADGFSLVSLTPAERERKARVREAKKAQNAILSMDAKQDAEYKAEQERMLNRESSDKIAWFKEQKLKQATGTAIPCKFFAKGERCPHGVRCMFSHKTVAPKGPKTCFNGATCKWKDDALNPCCYAHPAVVE
jgi:hypothetical protein